MALPIGSKRLAWAIVAAVHLGMCGNAWAEPLPMPAIPIAVSEPRPTPEVIPAGVVPPIIVVPSISPPSELPSPSLPALTMPPIAAPKLEDPKPIIVAPLVFPAPGDSLRELKPSEVSPITPLPKAAELSAPSLPAKPELKLPSEIPDYNSTPVVAPALPTAFEKSALLEIAPPPSTTVPAPGEDNVKLKPSNAIKAAVIGAMIAVPPVSAEEPKIAPTVPTADVKATDADLKAQLAALKDEIKALTEKQSAYNDLIAGRADGKVVTPLDAGLMKRVENLENGMKKIEDRLKSIDDKLSSTTAGASPLAGSLGNAMTAGKSKVRLVNEYAVRISIIVNGASHQLDAKQLKDLEVPAGSFQYQLLADGAEKISSNIKEGETVTLRIR